MIPQFQLYIFVENIERSDYMLFWERFYSLCLSVNKKPNTICNELGFSSATSTHWKNGTMPKGDALLSLADYFDCSVDYLLGREETKKAAVLSVESSDTKKEQLIKNYELLNDEGQEDLLDYSEMLASNPRKIKESNNSVQMNA